MLLKLKKKQLLKKGIYPAANVEENNDWTI